MVKIFPERLFGIQIVLAESERSGRRGCPRVHQSHLHNIKLLRRRAQERAPIGDLYAHIRTLIEMLRIVSVAAAHDRRGDDGVDLDPSDASASIRHGTKHVNAAARTDNRKVAMRPQNIGQSRRGGHQILLPVGIVPLLHVRIHDVGGRIGIDDDGFGLPLAVHFYA